MSANMLKSNFLLYQLKLIQIFLLPLVSSLRIKHYSGILFLPGGGTSLIQFL